MTQLASKNPTLSKDGIAALVWISLGGLLFWQSFLLLGLEEATAIGIFGPAFYPKLLALLIMILGVHLLLKDLRRRSVSVSTETSDLDGDDAAAHPPDLRLSVVAFMGLIGYTYLLSKIGYLLITPIMLLGLMLLMGERRWLMMIVWAIGFSTGLHLLFRYALRVILPEGLLY